MDKYLKVPHQGEKVLYRCRWAKPVDLWKQYVIKYTGWGGSICLGKSYDSKDGFFPCDKKNIIPYEGNESIIGTTDEPLVKYDLLCVCGWDVKIPRCYIQ